jgi:hypothetical protein
MANSHVPGHNGCDPHERREIAAVDSLKRYKQVVALEHAKYDPRRPPFCLSTVAKTFFTISIGRPA